MAVNLDERRLRDRRRQLRWFAGCLMVFSIAMFWRYPQRDLQWMFPVTLAVVAYSYPRHWAWIFGLVGTLIVVGFADPQELLPSRNEWLLILGCAASIGWGLLVRGELISEKQRSRHDSVTGLLNSRGFEEQLSKEISRSYRQGRQFALLYLDCDRFKEVNDVQGHQFGDELLKKVGDVLSSKIRHHDQAARLGGDEFAVLISDADETTALTVVERLSANLDVAARAIHSQITFSVGVVLFEVPPTSVSECLALADQAMYRVKHQGRDGVRVEKYRADPKELVQSVIIEK